LPKSKTKISGKKNSSLKVVKRIISKSIVGHSKVISRSLDIFKKNGCGKVILFKKKTFFVKMEKISAKLYVPFFMFLEQFRSGRQFLFKKENEK
jgi:hypothetical protein